jgi:hypothetical protein
MICRPDEALFIFNFSWMYAGYSCFLSRQPRLGWLCSHVTCAGSSKLVVRWLGPECRFVSLLDATGSYVFGLCCEVKGAIGILHQYFGPRRASVGGLGLHHAMQNHFWHLDWLPTRHCFAHETKQ